MTNVRAMLERVRKLEAAQALPRSPIQLTYGSLGAFEDQTVALIDAGKLDGIDMPIVLAALRRWHLDGVWRTWSRTRSNVWEHGGK